MMLDPVLATGAQASTAIVVLLGAVANGGALPRSVRRSATTVCCPMR